MRPARLVAAFLLVLPAIVSLPGCGYHLAGMGGAHSFLPEGVHAIGIPTLHNETDRPEIEQRITEALVDEFVHRGRLEAVAGREGADVVLEGTIMSFRTDPVTFTARGRYDRVEVTITARMRLTQVHPEKVLWSQNHFVFQEQYDVPETPLSQVDREIVAIEEIARDFARSVVTSILEGF